MIEYKFISDNNPEIQTPCFGFKVTNTENKKSHMVTVSKKYFSKVISDEQVEKLFRNVSEATELVLK